MDSKLASFSAALTEQMALKRAAEEELAEISGVRARHGGTFRSRDVTVALSLPSPHPEVLELQLTYCVSNAGWQPSYDLRVIL